MKNEQLNIANASVDNMYNLLKIEYDKIMCKNKNMENQLLN